MLACKGLIVQLCYRGDAPDG
ncbi:hypothetical protein Goklo_021433 [Gossypium klotzschianum]|uniref:Uncharacterized protein n=1 Tax=Gossypium klotzschianum TaxID=34286 RepID=A0A7J8UVB6_9ROSI|nr:hypothetical protein [Gossypium klotzschianum]